jgi:hypothetical protein
MFPAGVGIEPERANQQLTGLSTASILVTVSSSRMAAGCPPGNTQMWCNDGQLKLATCQDISSEMPLLLS